MRAHVGCTRNVRCVDPTDGRDVRIEIQGRTCAPASLGCRVVTQTQRVVSSAVEDVLLRHFVSPSTVLWPVCRQLKLDATSITPDQLSALIPLIGATVQRVTDPENSARVVAALRALR